MEGFESKNRSDLALTAEAIEHLRITRKWTKFLSILGLIVIVLMVIVALFAVVSFFKVREGSFLPAILPAVLLIIVYFFPIYYLIQFSSHSKDAITNHNSESLTSAFKYLKLHYTFIGILVIIMLIFYVVGGGYMLLTFADRLPNPF